jgi:hypothetical protein
MESWRKELIARLEARNAMCRQFEQTLSDYEECVARLTVASNEAQVLRKENKLLRFELVNFDLEKLRALEEENVQLKQRLRTREMARSMPSLMAHGSESDLARELQAANEQNAHLKTLLKQARSGQL